MSTLPCMRRKPHAIAEGSVIRSMDYGEGGPDYRVHYAVTSLGLAAKISGPPEFCYPAEPPEWEITGIDGEVITAKPDGGFESTWVPIEETHDRLEIDAVEHWAEMLELSDEVVEDAEAEREAYLEQQAEFRRDALEDAADARREKRDEEDMGW